MLRELDQLDRVEVVLDGVTVAILTDRVVTDMFWRSYRIEPVGDSRSIYDDDLWIRCRFAFRDPASKRMCTTAFAGGAPPYVSDGRVAIRAMYFDNEDKP